MAGVPRYAWNRGDALACVPGVMTLLPDNANGRPKALSVPRWLGPICEPCWLGDQLVAAVGMYGCTHGGSDG